MAQRGERVCSDRAGAADDERIDIALGEDVREVTVHFREPGDSVDEFVDVVAGSPRRPVRIL